MKRIIALSLSLIMSLTLISNVSFADYDMDPVYGNFQEYPFAETFLEDSGKWEEITSGDLYDKHFKLFTDQELNKLIALRNEYLDERLTKEITIPFLFVIQRLLEQGLINTDIAVDSLNSFVMSTGGHPDSRNYNLGAQFLAFEDYKTSFEPAVGAVMLGIDIWDNFPFIVKEVTDEYLVLETYFNNRQRLGKVKRKDVRDNVFVYFLEGRDKRIYNKENGFIITTGKALVEGYPDHTMRLDNSITRAEATKIFYNILKQEGFTENDQAKVSEVALTDIDGHWAEKEIKKLVSMGIIKGYPDGSFKPDKTINTLEGLYLLVQHLDSRGVTNWKKAWPTKGSKLDDLSILSPITARYYKIDFKGRLVKNGYAFNNRKSAKKFFGDYAEHEITDMMYPFIYDYLLRDRYDKNKATNMMTQNLTRGEFLKLMLLLTTHIGIENEELLAKKFSDYKPLDYLNIWRNCGSSIAFQDLDLNSMKDDLLVDKDGEYGLYVKGLFTNWNNWLLSIPVTSK